MAFNPIQGTSGPEELFGTSGADRILSLAGDDIVWAGDGDDWVDGRDGWDQVFGGDGNDELRGSGSYDQLAGGSGDDTLRGGAGDDDLYGGAGEDEVFGGPGDDRLTFEYGDEGQDTLWGNTGRDYFSIHGGAPGLARAFGGAGDDTFSLDLNPRGAVLDGGAGRDRLSVDSYGSDLRVVATGSGGTVQADGQVVATFRDVERFSIQGGTGDDVVRTLGANDAIRVFDGANSVLAGGGRDVVAYTLREANHLAGGVGTDTLVIDVCYWDRIGFDATQGTDTFGSTLTSFERFEIWGMDEADHVAGAQDRDTFRLNGGADIADGRGGDDLVWGGSGRDRLTGGSGHDILGGDEGRDELLGGKGRDQLTGWTGRDELTGGSGGDIFVFVSGDRRVADLITDFEAGVDRIGLYRGRLHDALPLGSLDPARFHEGGPVGTEGQFVLLDEGTNDHLVWDANGIEAGGVVEIAILTGASGLTAQDISMIF